MTHEPSSIKTRKNGEGCSKNALEKATQGAVGAAGEGQKDAMAEEWRPIAGYEGLYEVSNRGRIRSLLRVVENPAKLANEAVLEIRSAYKLPGITQQALSDRFKISRSTVGGIVRGEIWTHLPL